MTKIDQKIPEGWSVKKLKDLSKKGIFNGIFNDPQKVGRGVPLINVVDLYQDNINFSNLSLLEVTEDELVKYEAKEGDLLFTRSSLKLEGIAHCNLVKKYSERVVYDCHLMRVRTNQALAIPYYLYTFCNTKMAKKNFMSNAKTTTMTTIDQKGLGNVSILLPPLAEQKKIAEILSCWDEGIEKLSALIEKKKIQKKALMQQLLTGKHRLKGFATPWHEVKLGDIAEKITRKNLNQYTNVVTISAQNGFILQQQFFSKSVAGEDLSSYNLLKCGEFGYNRSYSKGFPMGAIKRLDLFDVAPVSSLYICFSVNEYIDSNFMVNYFDAGLQNYELYKVAQEGARNHGLLNISLHDFFNIKLYIPSSLAEQKAIADILSKADKEIELLNKKLAAFKLEKKALMQKLLTGQIRVKVN